MKYAIRLFAILFLSIHLNAIAQVEKRDFIIGIPSFISHVETDLKDDASVIQDYVTEAFVSAKRFTVVDRRFMNKINEELEVNKGDPYILSDFLVEQGKQLGASHLLIGSIDKITFQDKRNTALKLVVPKILKADKEEVAEEVAEDKLTAYVDLKIHLVNVETSEIEEEKTLSIGQSLDIGAPDEHKALQNLKDDVDRVVKDFILERWPLNLKFLKVIDMGKDRITSFYVNGGRNLNLKDGARFKIMKVEHFELSDGKTDVLEIEVGRASIQEVRGEEVSLCKVTQGAKQLYESVQKGDQIVCQLIP